jgi:hypothetical protein
MRSPWALLLGLTFSAISASAEPQFEVEFVNYRGGDFRREQIYRIEGGVRTVIQERIYDIATNSLREAAFLQKNGSMRLYGDANLPKMLRGQVAVIDARMGKRIEVEKFSITRPPVEGHKPGEVGDPILIPAPSSEAPAPKVKATDSSLAGCVRGSDGRSIVCTDGVYIRQTQTISDVLNKTMGPEDVANPYENPYRYRLNRKPAGGKAGGARIQIDDGF